MGKQRALMRAYGYQDNRSSVCKFTESARTGFWRTKPCERARP